MFILSTLTIDRSKYLVVGLYFARGNGRLYCSGVLCFYPFSFSVGIPESLDEKERCLPACPYHQPIVDVDALVPRSASFRFTGLG